MLLLLTEIIRILGSDMSCQTLLNGSLKKMLLRET